MNTKHTVRRSGLSTYVAQLEGNHTLTQSEVVSVKVLLYQGNLEVEQVDLGQLDCSCDLETEHKWVVRWSPHSLATGVHLLIRNLIGTTFNDNKD